MLNIPHLSMEGEGNVCNVDKYKMHSNASSVQYSIHVLDIPRVYIHRITLSSCGFLSMRFICMCRTRHHTAHSTCTCALIRGLVYIMYMYIQRVCMIYGLTLREVRVAARTSEVLLMPAHVLGSDARLKKKNKSCNLMLLCTC